MIKQNKIKQLKKQHLIEDIEALLKQIDDVKLYIIRPAIEKIVLSYFSQAKDLFIYYVNIYAIALYQTHRQPEDKKLLKVLKSAEKDIDKFIADYELSKIDMLETEDLPF